MSRSPHVFLPGPWERAQLDLPPDKKRHLTRVLRLSDGAALTYTDGAGGVGQGLLADGAITRGREWSCEPRSARTFAVAPPRSSDRARFIVEKLTEVGVARLVWLDADRSVGPPPKPDKALSWSIAALEQSLGAWLPGITSSHLDDLNDVWLADRGGEPWPSGGPGPGAAIAIGPEGGWTDAEKRSRRLVSLGETVLRVETAAIVAVVLDRHV